MIHEYTPSSDFDRMQWQANLTRSLDPLVNKVKLARPRFPNQPKGWWMDPKGAVHLVPEDQTHESWIDENHGLELPEAFHHGWQRMVGVGKTLMLYNRQRQATQDQLRAVKDHALANKHEEVQVFGPKDMPAQQVRLSRPTKLARGDSDERAFHGAMAADHNDRTTRLVYADWLDEHGFDLAAKRLRWWVRAKEHLIAPHKKGRPIDLSRLPHFARRLALVHRAWERGPQADPRFRSVLASAERDALGVETEEEWTRNHALAEAWTVRLNGLVRRQADRGDRHAQARLAALHAHRARNPDPAREPHMFGSVTSGHGWISGGNEQTATHRLRQFAATDDPTKLARNELKTVGAGGANRMLGSANHAKRVELAQKVLAEAGLTQARVSAVLAHTDQRGARPAVAALIAQAHPKVAKFAAAWLGLLTGQHALTVFHPGEGEDTLHVIDSPHPADHVGEYLRRAGVPRFTLESRGAGTRAYVVNPMDLIDVGTAAKGLGGSSNAIRGRAVRMGAGGEAEARAAYRTVIEDAEKEAGL